MATVPFIGFQATFADGTVRRESDGYWDDVPNAGIARLALVSDGAELIAFDGKPGRRFYFSNECVAQRGGYGILSAKIIGYVDPDPFTPFGAGRATEARIDYLPNRFVGSLRGAISTFQRALGAVTHPRVKMSPRRRRALGGLVAQAHELLEATDRDLRLTWRTFPAEKVPFGESAFRAGA